MLRPIFATTVFLFVACLATLAVSGSELHVPMQPATQIRCWFQGDGAATFLSGNTGAGSGTTAKVDITGGSGRIGIDYRARPCWIVGGGLGYHGGTLSSAGTNMSLTASQLVAQTELRWRRLVFRMDGGYIGEDKSTTITPIAARYKIIGDQTDFGVSLRIPNEIGFSILEPIIAFRHTQLVDSTGWYSVSRSRIAMMLGGRYTYRYRTPFATVLPSVDAMWIHADTPNGLIAPADWEHIIPAYFHPHAVVPPDLFHLGVGVTSLMGRSLDLSLRYAVQMGSGTSHHALVAAMNWNF